MIDIRKPKEQQITLIRAATGRELSDYEKQKLASIENNAQENKIEVITLNNQRLPIDSNKKEVHIELGDLAFKNKVDAASISAEELFFIKCELDDVDM